NNYPLPFETLLFRVHRNCLLFFTLDAANCFHSAISLPGILAKRSLHHLESSDTGIRDGNGICLHARTPLLQTQACTTTKSRPSAGQLIHASLVQVITSPIFLSLYPEHERFPVDIHALGLLRDGDCHLSVSGFCHVCARYAGRSNAPVQFLHL